MVWKLACGVEVLIDEEDYSKIDKKGWYLSDEFHGKDNRKTRYVIHDKYGRLHRYILGFDKNEKTNCDDSCYAFYDCYSINGCPCNHDRPMEF